MTKVSGALLAASVAVLLAGCGTAPVRGGSAAQVDSIDHQRVAAVEQAARASGARVVWVRPP
jgi:starvation-inducible outer membrane lipoprotein